MSGELKKKVNLTMDFSAGGDYCNKLPQHPKDVKANI